MAERVTCVAPQPRAVGADGAYAEYYEKEALQYLLDYIEQTADSTFLAKAIVVRRTD